MNITLKLNTDRLLGLVRTLHGQVEAGFGNPDLQAGGRDAQSTYLGEQRARFQANSRGGGEWRDLAPATKLARFRKAGGRVTKGQRAAVAAIPFPILYETGSLYTSLIPGQPGSYEATTADVMTNGSAVDYAAYHQSGGGNLPKRKILNEPEAETLNRMQAIMTDSVRALVNRAVGNG